MFESLPLPSPISIDDEPLRIAKFHPCSIIHLALLALGLDVELGLCTHVLMAMEHHLSSTQNTLRRQSASVWDVLVRKMDEG